MIRKKGRWSYFAITIIFLSFLTLNLSCSKDEEDDDVFVGASQPRSFVNYDIDYTSQDPTKCIIEIRCMVYYKTGVGFEDYKIYFKLLEKYEPVQIIVSDASAGEGVLNEPDIVEWDNVVDLADIQEGEIFCEINSDIIGLSVCRVTSSVPDSTYVIEIFTDDGWTSNPITIHFPPKPDVPEVIP